MSVDACTGICGKRTRRAPRFVVAVVYVARVCQGYASWCLGVQNQLAYFLTIGTSGDCLNRPLSCPIARSACGPPDRAQFSLKEFYRENFKFQNSSKTMSKPSDDDNRRITLFSDRWNGSRTPGFLKFKRDFKTGMSAVFLHEDDYSLWQALKSKESDLAICLRGNLQDGR